MTFLKNKIKFQNRKIYHRPPNRLQMGYYNTSLNKFLVYLRKTQFFRETRLYSST